MEACAHGRVLGVLSQVFVRSCWSDVLGLFHVTTMMGVSFYVPTTPHTRSIQIHTSQPRPRAPLQLNTSGYDMEREKSRMNTRVNNGRNQVGQRT